MNQSRIAVLLAVCSCVLLAAAGRADDAIHLEAPPAVLRAAATDVLVLNPTVSPSGSYEEFSASADPVLSAVSVGPMLNGSVPPGDYGPVVYPVEPAYKLTIYGNSLFWGTNVTKLKVLPGSRPSDSSTPAALWVVFPLYHNPDDPIGLGEIRHNISPEQIAGAPPIVDAGMDRDLTRTSRRQLHGAAMGVVGASAEPVTTQWSVVSGPGTVTFTDASAADSGVDFSSPGTYLLRLTATQGGATSSDDVVFNVEDLETSFIFRDYQTGKSSYLPADGNDVRVWEYTGDRISVDCGTYAYAAHESWQLTFTAPPWQSFVVGQKYSFSTSYANGLIIEGSNGEKVSPWYDFTILELTADAHSNVTSLRIAFQSYTGGAPGQPKVVATAGELRFRAHVPAGQVNQSPKVDAGPAQYLSGTRKTVLTAAITDDLLPLGQPVTCTWSQVSGPAPAAIDPGTPIPTVNFTANGTYVFRCTVSDSEYTVSDDMTVVVGSSPVTYRGFITNSDGVIVGLLQLRVLPSGRFSGALVSENARLPLSGVFQDGTFVQSYFVRDGTGRQITLTRSANQLVVSGDLWSDAATYSFSSVQDAEPFLLATHAASPYAGTFTWLAAPPPAGNEPYGFGFGTASIDARGGFRLAGRLADGRAISCASAVGLDAQAAFFWSLPGVEQIGGIIHFGQSAGSPVFAAALPWYRYVNARDPRFPKGVAEIAQFRGERYVPPAKGQNLLNGSSADVPLQWRAMANGWTAPLSGALTLPSTNRIAPTPPCSVLLDPRSGLFQGTLLDPAGKKRTFMGVFTQPSRGGAGAFFTDTGVGAVEIVPAP